MEISKVETGKWDANHAIRNGPYRFYTCAYEHFACDTKRWNEPCLVLPGNGANVGEVFYYDGPFDAYQRTYVISKIAIDPMFLFYHFQLFWKNRNEEKQYGSATNYIRIGNFKDYKLALPPLPEQRAIVAKLEVLLGALDRSKGELEVAREKLGVYRQSVLKEAFGGRLTEEWRKENNTLSSSEILEMIIDARKNVFHKQILEYEKEVDDWTISGELGKKPRKPRRLDSPEKPTAEHERLKWTIPVGWTWTQLGEVSFVTKLAGFEYTKLVDYSSEGDIPVIKAENAGKKGFKITGFSHVHEDVVRALPRTNLVGGELLVTFVGAGTGSVATVPKDRKYFLGPNIGMARPYMKIDEKYLQYFYQSPVGKALMLATVKAVAQPSLSMGTIRQAPLALPSLPEQRQIVSEIESRFSVADALEREIAAALERVEGVRMGVLKRAFGGELLTSEELKNLPNE